jgi:hypothetical protein
VLTAVATVSAVLGATSSWGESTHRGLISPFYSPGGSLAATPPSSSTTLPPQSGYRGTENFCAVAPLTGNIHYDGASGELAGVLTVTVGGLQPDEWVYAAWSNDYVRSPVIAVFRTDSNGTAVQASVDVERLGEVRGVEILLLAESVPNPVLGRLEPC